MASTVADWIVYAAARGTTVADDTDSATALVRAQDYVTHHYVNRFSDSISVDDDLLDAAVYEAAALELATPKFFSRTYTPDQQKVLVAVDGIRWQVRGDVSGTDAATPVSTKIEDILRPYLVTIAGAFVT